MSDRGLWPDAFEENETSGLPLCGKKEVFVF
jgi:hypothetical protein